MKINKHDDRLYKKHKVSYNLRQALNVFGCTPYHNWFECSGENGA